MHFTIYFWTDWAVLNNTLLIRNAFLTVCENSHCQRKEEKNVGVVKSCKNTFLSFPRKFKE